MYTGGWSTAELAEVKRLLLGSHAIRIDIQMMTIDHKMLGQISNRLLGGAVDVDADAEVSRSLKLDLLDINQTLNLDRDDPSDGAMYLDRMIRVVYNIGRPDGSKWYGVPVFTGPVTKVNRNGVVLSVECQGKESLANDNSWSARSWKAALRHTIIRALLAGAGEAFFKITESRSKTSGATNLTRETSPFRVAKSLASAMSFRLFYNGSGTAVLRPASTKSVWTFDGTCLTSAPQVSYDLSSFYNAVSVKGGTPKGRKIKKGKNKGERTKEKQRSARVVAPSSHPLSPSSLKRNGKPRYKWIEITDSSLKTNADCVKAGQKKLKDGLIQAVDTSFNALPIPLLEENDAITVVTPKYTGSAYAKRFTISLGPETMSMGYNKRVRPSKLSTVLLRK